MSGIVFLIIIVGAAVGVFTFFVVKSFITPRQMENLVLALRQGKTQTVIRQAKQLIAKDSRNVNAHYFLGKAYLKEEKPELALMEYKIVNQIGQFTDLTHEAPFRKEAAQLYRRFNQSEEALKEYLLLMKKNPDVAEHYFLIGELFEERQMGDKAQQYYRKTVELDSGHAGAHMRLGILYSRNKKSLEAKAELEVALKLEPENSKAHFYMGRLLKEMHDYAAALRSFEVSQRDLDFKVKSLIEAGACYMSMNNLERAISSLERAVGLDKELSSTEQLYSHYFLSLSYERSRKIDEAIEQWEFIYAKKPSFKDVAQKLSQYQELRSDDKMKDYMVSGSEEFLSICKGILTVLKLEVRDAMEIPNGYRIAAVDREKNWRVSRKIPRLLMFLRVTEAIDESTVRNLLEMMKKNSINRGVIVTSSNFTSQAKQYADTRPVDLVNKEQLSGLLNEAKG